MKQNNSFINDKPLQSRAFLLFSIVAGFVGTFLAIVGTGMVCCNARCIPAVQVKGPKISVWSNLDFLGTKLVISKEIWEFILFL